MRARRCARPARTSPATSTWRSTTPPRTPRVRGDRTPARRPRPRHAESAPATPLSGAPTSPSARGVVPGTTLGAVVNQRLAHARRSWLAAAGASSWRPSAARRRCSPGCVGSASPVAGGVIAAAATRRLVAALVTRAPLAATDPRRRRRARRWPADVPRVGRRTEPGGTDPRRGDCDARAQRDVAGGTERGRPADEPGARTVDAARYGRRHGPRRRASARSLEHRRSRRRPTAPPPTSVPSPSAPSCRRTRSRRRDAHRPAGHVLPDGDRAAATVLACACRSVP